MIFTIWRSIIVPNHILTLKRGQAHDTSYKNRTNSKWKGEMCWVKGIKNTWAGQQLFCLCFWPQMPRFTAPSPRTQKPISSLEVPPTLSVMARCPHIDSQLLSTATVTNIRIMLYIQSALNNLQSIDYYVGIWNVNSALGTKSMTCTYYTSMADTIIFK